MLKLILLSNDHVNIGRFYESCRNRQKWLQQYLLGCDEKSFKHALIVSRFINIHKLRCHMIHKYCIFCTIMVFIKVLKVLVNNREVTLCIPKTAQKANRVDN